MRNHILKIICCLSILGIAGCIKEIAPEQNESSELSEYIQFTTKILGMTKSTVTRTYNSGHLVAEESPWLDFGGTQTKADAMMQLSGDVALTMFAYDAWSETAESWAANTNAKYQFDGNALVGKMVRWSSIANKEKLRVFACAPYFESAVQNTVVVGTPKISFSPDADVKKQVDLVASMAEVSVAEERNGRVVLGFEHVLTGIRFRAGFDCSINWIRIDGVNTKADYLIGTGWTNLAESGSYKIEYNKTFGAGDNITGKGETLMLIPQTLGDGAKVVMNNTVGSQTKELSSSLTGITWEQGKMITYTLYDSTKESSFIYFDLAAGNVNIEPGENKVTGYVYEKGNPEPVLKAYTHSDDKTYYVYQSTKAKRDAGSGVVDGGKVILPEYPAIVTPSGQSWADFITNNTSVENVIETWDDGKDVRGEDAPDENLIGTAVVRTAGRTHTRNYIKVTGQDAKYNLTIDNIYSVIQQPVNSGQAFRLRSVGGIAYIPAGNTELTVNFVGDNRMGCLHIDNTPTDKISLQGTGTLTVADADFLTVKDVGDYSSDFGDNKGYISNFWNSAIGNNTDDNTGEKVYNLYINSGVVFAGATKTEDCSAIGGGGNGFGQVYITGGTVTAVAATAGTAIGGGMGHTAKGGPGEVHISGGNVYAYNFPNRWSIPSSAIGGGSSYKNVGQGATVNISGGYVYAYSGIGTAIGGGSSYSQVGGDAVINISGGDITAISGEGSGIGGGSACTGGSTTAVHNGGNAVVNISGNPVIRTGSIGGGITKAKAGSKIGSAIIDISGGDIQAQFVMAAGAKEVPEFTMSGGVIRNSDVSDPMYIHVQKNGGAVYMEDGNFTMTGGIIMDCYAKKGGAIYIKKDAKTDTPPSFKMSGGEIARCCSETDGGAVYLEDGTVEVSERAKIRSCYTGEGGKGGAICINKTGALNPSFTMSGGELSRNAAGSLGGAVHLEGGSFTISNGTISGNLVENGNGGAISINSGSFLMDKVSHGNGATINGNSALSKTDDTGYGGGVYITTGGQDVEVDILAGSIVGNSSARVGGGICVDLPSRNVSTTVTVGKPGSNDLEYPNITSNITLLSGGGLYVNGQHANVVVNSGTIKNNETVGYVDNPDIMNETGMVTLNGGNVKSVDVTYAANGGDSIEGETIGQTEIVQRIVIDTNNTLVVPSYYRNGYKLVGWNTRADGLGTSYANGQVVKRSTDLKLYAIWQIQ